MNKYIKGLVLLTLSILLMLAATWIAGFDNVLVDLKRFPALIVIGVTTILLLNICIVSYRLNQFLRLFGIDIPYRVALRASVQGQFVSLFFISLIGQVAGRQMVLRQYGIPPVLLALLTGMEKVVLFIVSAGLSLVAAIWLLGKNEIISFFNKIPLISIIIIFALSLSASLLIGRSRFETQLIRTTQFLKLFHSFLKIFLITLFAQTLICSVYVLGAFGLTNDLNLMEFMAAAAITSFAASVPISVNGWGVREITAIFAFGQVGLEPSSALALSILVGLSSTAIILLVWPISFIKKSVDIEAGLFHHKINYKKFIIEKISTWGLGIAVVILVFFQIHIPLQGGLININLADGFALLAFIAVLIHCLSERELPRWSIPRFNLLIAVITGLLIFAFLNGMQTIGITQWALGGRLIGWIVLLGYSSIGLLTVTYLGMIGVRRLIETLVITATLVIIYCALLRWLAFSGFIDFDNLPLNFEGFSGNRNAFAFLLLASQAFLLTYFPSENQQKLLIKIASWRLNRHHLVYFSQGIIFAGIIFTGSKAGILTEILILIIFSFLKIINKKILFFGMTYGSVIWLFFVILLPTLTQYLINTQNHEYAVQSIFSNNVSNVERWQTILRGIELWAQSPWLGVGLGVFIESSTQWFSQPIVIHSTPVWILTEFGIIGLAVFCIIFLYIIIQIFRSHFKTHLQRSIIVVVASFFIFGLVHDIFYQRIFWLVIGICFAMPLRKSFMNPLTNNSSFK